MHFNNPFAEESLKERKCRQQLDRVLRVTAPHERIIQTGLGLLVLALVTWLAFGGIALSVNASGVLVGSTGRTGVSAPRSGHAAEGPNSPERREVSSQTAAGQSLPDFGPSTALGMEARLLGGFRSPGGTGTAPRHPGPGVGSGNRQERPPPEGQPPANHVSSEVASLRDGRDYHRAGGSVAARLEGEQMEPVAVLEVDPRVAARIRPGMPATIDVTLPDRFSRRYEGAVESVTIGPRSDDPAAGPHVGQAGAAPRIEVSLLHASDLSVPEGTPVRVSIDLGKHALGTLLRLGTP